MEELIKRPLYVFDLPRELLSTLEPAITGEAPQAASLQSQDRKDLHTAQGREDGEISKIASCALCSLTFADVREQRTHVRSDAHRYNIKQRQRGLAPVSEADFDKLVGDLDESISGSDTTSSSDDGSDEDQPTSTSQLRTLLKRQADLDDTTADNFTKKRKRGAGSPPLLWFKSSTLPHNTTIGVYRSLFTPAEQASETDLPSALQSKQCAPQKPLKATNPRPNPPDGGVALPPEAPNPTLTPHVFLCMIGGGHFAAMVVSLAPKITKNPNSVDARQATVIAHKTFHRYTTRRKQGGAQSANDNAKGNAHSAGSSLRRYNEEALVNEVQALLYEWKDMIRTSELLFVRATGSTNRNTLFGLAKEDPKWPLGPNDPRLRGFPFSTRRATEAELMRCFVELTRAKVRVTDLEAERKAALEEEDRVRLRREEEEARTARKKELQAQRAAASAQEQEASLHTSQLIALIRRNKAPAVLSYLTTNGLNSSYEFYPRDLPAHYHAPTPLHMAASNNAAPIVTALLIKGGADPTIVSIEEKTPFELAGDRATRDAFRLARHELGEARWKWDSARVPDALSKDDVAQRAEQEQKDEKQSEEAKRKEGLESLRAEEARKEEDRKRRGDDKRDQKHGKGKTMMTAGRERTAEERRADEARGMTPEMKMRMEREKRARAVEERMKRMQQGQA